MRLMTCWRLSKEVKLGGTRSTMVNSGASVAAASVAIPIRNWARPLRLPALDSNEERTHVVWTFSPDALKSFCQFAGDASHSRPFVQAHEHACFHSLPKDPRPLEVGLGYQIQISVKPFLHDRNQLARAGGIAAYWRQGWHGGR